VTKSQSYKVTELQSDKAGKGLIAPSPGGKGQSNGDFIRNMTGIVLFMVFQGTSMMTPAEIQDVLSAIVVRITGKFDPDKIVLFGSYARGTPNSDSDADILVIMRVPGSRRKKAVEIDFLMQGIPIPTDIIVVSPEEVERSLNCPGSIVNEAIREGKVLYERAA
jgi:uncharacterized protein